MQRLTAKQKYELLEALDLGREMIQLIVCISFVCINFAMKRDFKSWILHLDLTK